MSEQDTPPSGSRWEPTPGQPDDVPIGGAGSGFAVGHALGEDSGTGGTGSET